MISLAEKNNNPGCLKQVPGNWQGAPKTDERGHAIFVLPMDGCRALIKTLEAKYNNDKRSLLAITASWAPVDDAQGSIPGNPQNDPNAYAVALSKWTGYDVYQDLDLFNQNRSARSYDRLLAVCRGIERYEAGKLWVPEHDWIGGLALYVRDFVRVSDKMIPVEV